MAARPSELRPRVVDAANRILTYLALNEDVLANQAASAAQAAGIGSEELVRAKELVTSWSLEDTRLDVIENRVREYYQRDGVEKGYVQPGSILTLDSLRQREKEHYYRLR